MSSTHRPRVAFRVGRPADRGDDAVAIEEPLEIRIGGAPVSITMRTPGDDLDLVAGWLYTEGFVDGADDLAALAHVDRPGEPKGNTVDCVLAAGIDMERIRDRASRERYASSACGICGKAAIDRLRAGLAPVPALPELDPAFVSSLPDRLLAHQATFQATGGVHAAGLFTPDGELELVREDVGRHNAVDKVLGSRLRADRVPVSDRILVVTSRAGFEIVHKAWAAQIPALVAVGAPSSLAIDAARQAGIALWAFVREDRATRY